jgi:hypothetical protein
MQSKEINDDLFDSFTGKEYYFGFSGDEFLPSCYLKRHTKRGECTFLYWEKRHDNSLKVKDKFNTCFLQSIIFCYKPIQCNTTKCNKCDCLWENYLEHNTFFHTIFLLKNDNSIYCLSEKYGHYRKIELVNSYASYADAIADVLKKESDSLFRSESKTLPMRPVCKPKLWSLKYLCAQQVKRQMFKCSKLSILEKSIPSVSYIPTYLCDWFRSCNVEYWSELLRTDY